MGSKKCVGRRVTTRVFVRGDTGLDIVNEGGDVGDPGEDGMVTERFFIAAGECG